jgi:cobalt/nickel transport system permease protein
MGKSKYCFCLFSVWGGMTKIDKYFFDIGHMDILSAGDSPFHRLDPRAKLITTLGFICIVVSFNKYEISALIPFLIYPVVLMAVGDIPAGYILKKVLLISPIAVLIGLFNPLVDQGAFIQIGKISISGGWISFLSIIIRFLLTVGTALIFIALTGFNTVCMALERLGTPKVFVVQLLFLYRYLFVLVDESARMVRARSLRVFDSSGMGIKSFGPMLGHLLLRTLDRAQRIHIAMSCRGFDGRIRIVRPFSIGFREILFISGWLTYFVLMRVFNGPHLIGTFVTELFL